MTINVYILGAGAMGGAFAQKFDEAEGFAVYFVAAGERLQRLRREGLIINEQRYDFTVLGPDDDGPLADLVLVALKDHHLPDPLHLLHNRVGDETIILSVMNGLDSEAAIGEVLGHDRVLPAVSVAIDATREENRITTTSIGKIVFGEWDNTITPRIHRVQRWLQDAAIGFETPPDIRRAMWWKFMVNVGINQPSAILGASYAVFQTNAHAKAIMDAAMAEVLAVAQAEQVDLTKEAVAEWYAILAGLPPDGKTSMLQDVEAGRRTEVDMFAGKVIALGQAHGIPTPVNALLLHAIKVLEDV